MLKEVKEKCGLFAIYNHPQAALLTFLGLYSLQHRGEESCGIISSDGSDFSFHRGMGLVSETFNDEVLRKLKGNQAIGHVRYSTTGSSAVRNIQPLFANSHKFAVALAHNGNLVNAPQLRHKLENQGAIFHTTSDSELILHCLIRSKGSSLVEKITSALNKLKGAYSLVMMTREAIIGIRDPFGVRPLSLGRKDESYIIASESCAFDLLKAEFVREIEPGEIVVINKEGLSSFKYSSSNKKSFCLFEFVYFARPDSVIFSETVHLVREKLGRKLAREHPVSADICIGVPDSGTSAALGFSKESGIPLEIGVIRNHYIGRTFIQPYKEKRELGVKLKFNILKEVIKGKRVVIVDDSIVRGTTSRIRVKTFRELGAEEVHLRISCPPHRYPCFYGIDFPDPASLVAHKRSVNQIKEFLGVDSLGYLSLEGMFSCLSKAKDNYCAACWNGKYPIKCSGLNKYALETY